MTSNGNTTGPAKGSWDIPLNQSPNTQTTHTSLGLFEQHVATGWIVQDLSINNLRFEGAHEFTIRCQVTWFLDCTSCQCPVQSHNILSAIGSLYRLILYAKNTISYKRTLESVAKKIGACWVLTLPRGEGPEQKHWSPPRRTLMFCCLLLHPRRWAPKSRFKWGEIYNPYRWPEINGEATLRK